MDWSQIIVPAGVAAVVTILIEYAAKPGLEARKERILERSRVRRELLAVLAQIQGNLIALEDFSPDVMDHIDVDARGALAGELERFRSEVDDLSAELYRLAVLCGNQDSITYNYLTSAAGKLRGAILTKRPATALGIEAEDEVMIISIGLLQTSRFTVRGQKLRRVARKWLDELSPPPQESRQ